MIQFTRAISCIGTILIGLVAPAHVQAQTPNLATLPQLDVLPKQPLPPLKIGRTYAVDIDCRPIGPQLSPITDNGFFHTAYTTSHAILISTQQATSSTNSTWALPSAGLGMTVVYITDGTSSSDVDNRNHGCKSFFLIRRQTNVFLIPFVSLHTSNQAGVVTTIFAAALTPLASVFSLITGGPLSASASKRITDFQNVESAFNTILSKLNTDFNYAKTLPLGVGLTTITTNQSVTTANVRPVSSLIQDKVDDFSNSLRALADGETVKVTEANPDTTCNQLSHNVALDGITTSEDRAYILGYEGIKNLQTKYDMMRCLGQLVAIAASMPAIWDGQPTMTVTPAMAEDFLKATAGPTQLPFLEVKNTLDQLMVAMGRYAQNGQPPSVANSVALAQFFVNNATITNNLFSDRFKGASIPSGFPKVVDFLITQGYYHFGCFAQTTDQTGLYNNGPQSIFLAFKAPASDTNAKKADTLAILPIFADSVHVIQNLEVSDNSDWISNVLSARSGTPPTVSDCNGFTVQ